MDTEFCCFLPERSFLVDLLSELMTVFLTVWQQKESCGKTIYEEYNTTSKLCSVNTNLVAVCSRCISVFLCVRQVKRYIEVYTRS